MPELVHLEVDDGVGIIRLDRPPANAISLQLSIELLAALEEAGSRDDVGALVLWGGPKLFAAGADIKEMVDHGPDEIREQVTQLGDACDLLEATPKVSIAAITGFALGGGFELSLACDLRYAADDAKVGQPEVRIGVIPGAGGTQRMTWLAGPGSPGTSATRAGRWTPRRRRRSDWSSGCCPRTRSSRPRCRTPRAFAHGPRRALAAAKEAINAAVRTPGPASIAREKELFIALFGGDDQREGMRAFIEKRPPEFLGS